MYKVFIENKPIIFTQNKKLESKSHSIKAEMIKSIKNDLLPILNLSNLDNPLYVQCDDAKKDFERIFKNYDKIDAAGGIVKRKKKLLFIKRNGFWDIPKGKLDSGESPEKGALREIEEECGISGMKIESPIVETYHTYDYYGKPTLKRTYWYAVNYSGPKEVIGQLEEGITKVKWFKMDELQKVKENTFASIIEVINHYLKG